MSISLLDFFLQPLLLQDLFGHELFLLCCWHVSVLLPHLSLPRIHCTGSWSLLCSAIFNGSFSQYTRHFLNSLKTLAGIKGTPANLWYHFLLNNPGRSHLRPWCLSVCAYCISVLNSFTVLSKPLPTHETMNVLPTTSSTEARDKELSLHLAPSLVQNRELISMKE